MSARNWLDPPYSGRRGSTSRFIDVVPGRHFTTVILDRDEYVYQARKAGREDDVMLRPGFENAVCQLVNSAWDYLVVHGAVGGSFTSLGPSIVTVAVPFERGEQAAQALRAAEMDGDLTLLDALTEALAIPLDEWLAPGERELRRGSDFTASPTAFLTFLRAKARQRGLHLHGRAIPGAVWVRPEMRKAQRNLLSSYPDRFPEFADPNPYLEYQEPDEALWRPYVGARSRRENAAEPSPVTFLAPACSVRRLDSCPCGFTFASDAADAAQHFRAHMQWSTGVPIPRGLTSLDDRVVVVTGLRHRPGSPGGARDGRVVETGAPLCGPASRQCDLYSRPLA